MMHLKQVKTKLQPSLDLTVAQRCLRAKELENVGKYEEARALLSDRWPEITQRPNLGNLTPYEQAELLLRTGTLAAWISSTKQIATSHEVAKDLITESIRAFQALGCNDRVSEGQTDLAICYWREGAMDEARILCREAFSLASLPQNKARVLINHASVEFAAGQSNEAQRLLKEAQPLVDALEDHATKGRYHIVAAAALKRSGGPTNLDRALIEYTAASIHFEAAGHTSYYALSENNISDLLLEVGRCDDAHQHVNNAYNTFRTLGDGTKTAQTLETRARIFIAQERYNEAERTALTAVKSLERSGQQALLAEALITRGIALARLEQRGKALAIFNQAEEIASTAGDTRSSIQAKLTSIEELGTFISPTQLSTLYLKTNQQIDETFDIARLTKLRTCAAITIQRLQQPLTNSSSPPIENYQLPESCVLPDEVLRFEAKVINAALDEANGSVTGAARRLGISHQGLGDILNGRHKNLRRNEPKRRRRPMMTLKKG